MAHAARDLDLHENVLRKWVRKQEADLGWPFLGHGVMKPELWHPRQVLITRSARTFTHGRAIAARAGAMGVPVVELPTDRLNLDLPEDPRRAYA